MYDNYIVNGGMGSEETFFYTLGRKRPKIAFHIGEIDIDGSSA